jgi:hypothetical protein
MLLTRCSNERAKELLGIEGDDATVLPDSDEFAQTWRKQLGLEALPDRPRSLTFPKEIKPLTRDARFARGFWRYLTDPLPEGRGFTDDQAEWVAATFKLHYAITGRFAYRIVIPVFDRLGNLMTWTGRALDAEADIRYLTLSSEEALAAPGNLVLGLPILSKAAPTRCLSVCEGPFDAMSVTALGHEKGVWGTCLFGLELSEAQSNLLFDIGDQFDRMRLLIDPNEAWLRNLSIRSGLPRRCQPIKIPQGFKDPGELVRNRKGEDFVLSLAA